MTTRRVGVEVNTTAIHSAIPPAVPGAGTVFMSGITERGSVTEPVLVESMTDYVNKLGNHIATDTLYYPVMGFFRSGGKRAYIARVVGTVPVKATLTLKDNSTSPGVNTVRMDAVDPGEFGNDLRVAVAAGTRASTTRITVTRASTGDVVADVDNITQDAAAAGVVAAFATNRWVRAVALGTGSGILKVIAATAMISGDADLDTVTDSAPYVTALSRFSADLGAGLVCIPGQPASAVTSGIQAHCEATTRIGAVSPPFGTSKSGALAAAEAVLAAGQEWVGMFWPHVSFQDGLVTRWVDPVIHAAACRSLAHVDGAWQAASAYPYNTSRFFSGTEVALTRSDVNDLATGNVNAIIRKNGRVILRAWFPLSESTDYTTLSVRDLMNVISVDLNDLLDEALVWKPVDGHGWLTAQANGYCSGYLEQIKNANGLYEKFDGQTMIDPGYVVDAGPTVNTAETLERDEVHIHVGIRPAPHAALIIVDLVKVGIGNAL